MMSVERTVRKQAKELLAGNWAAMIASLSFVAVCAMLLQYLFYLTVFSLGLIDLDTNELVEGNPLIYAVLGAALLAAVLASPLINGVLRIAYEIAESGNSDIKALFRYFKGGARYFKTVFLNIIITVVYGFAVSCLDAYRCAVSILGKDLFVDGFAFDFDTAVLVLMLVATIAVGLYFFLILAYYPLTVYAIDDSKSIFKYTIGLFLFSCRNLNQSVRLVFSFAGWIALCFLVLPMIYVVPYLLVSVMNSVRWLFRLERNGELKW